MPKLETRRINPIAHFASLAVVLLVVFEGFVIFGALELDAQTVAKYAPWAYEPFLRLVGEHPESAPRLARVERTREPEPVESTVAGVTGLEPAAIPVPMETNDTVLATNLVLEPIVPPEVDPDPVPVAAPTNSPPAKQEEIIPVG